MKAIIQHYRNATERARKHASIESNIGCFSYKNRNPIVDGVTISISENSSTAIVGSSGSRKSTISKLLLRFYEPESGEILIDGNNINDVTLKSLRSHIGFVPQDTVLFNASILENIQYGNVQASQSEVDKAIDLARLRTLVNTLPDGLNTLVGERGLKLSGGEKQRVAIARAILKDPNILVFDEATSSLDSESESEIMQAINAITRNKTCVMIAHRLSTIANADNIIVLDSGKVVEQGNHTTLLNLNKRYAQLWEFQKSQSGSGSVE